MVGYVLIKIEKIKNIKMKKALIGIVALALITLSITSCKKATAVNGGTWSFKGQTVTSGIASLNQVSPVVTAAYGNPYTISSLATVCQASNSYGDIVFNFWQYPTVSGSYPITSNTFVDSGSNAIAINMILSTGSNYVGKTYLPTPYSAATAMANVTVGSNGWITISIPSLEMVRDTVASDSSALTVNVKQTQAAE
jgi:hypothetical protein